MHKTAGCDNRMFYVDAHERLGGFADIKGHRITKFEVISMQLLDITGWFLAVLLPLG